MSDHPRSLAALRTAKEKWSDVTFPMRSLADTIQDSIDNWMTQQGFAAADPVLATGLSSVAMTITLARLLQRVHPNHEVPHLFDLAQYTFDTRLPPDPELNRVFGRLDA